MLSSSDFQFINTQPTHLLVDIKSFIIHTKLKENIIPFSAVSMFEELSIEFSIVSLFEKVEEDTSFMQKIKDKLIKPKSLPTLPFYGAVVTEDINGWLTLMQQYQSPLVVFEKPSSELLDAKIPVNRRVVLINHYAKEARIFLNNYYLKNLPQSKALKQLNPRDAYTAKVFSQGKRSNFGDKFNL